LLFIGVSLLIQCSLPFMLAIVFSSASSGLVISFTGNYWNIMVFVPWLRSIGAGLLYTLHETSSSGKYIGYQVRNLCPFLQQTINLSHRYYLAWVLVWLCR
jgi:hypothetical protein